MKFLTIFGKAMATALLGLEDATQAMSNPATMPADIAQFATGFAQIWFGTVTAGQAPKAVQDAYAAHVAARNLPPAQ